MHCDAMSLVVGDHVDYQATVRATRVGSEFAVNATVTSDRDNNDDNNFAEPIVLDVTQTCQQYDTDKSPYPCKAELKLNVNNATYASPDEAACCVSPPASWIQIDT